MTQESAIRKLRCEQERNNTSSIDIAYCMAIEALEKQIPQSPINKQGIPLWGCCPTCGDIVTRYGSPVGCKNCLQRLDWSKT